MVNLSPKTLITAILAVDAKFRELKNEIEDADDPDLAEFEEEMITISTAQAELKSYYVELAQAADNLPSYDELFSG